MTIPKISEGVAENVEREAKRDVIHYSHSRALELSKENPVLSIIMEGLAKEASMGEDKKDIYTKSYFGMIMVLSLVSNQLEVNELKEIWG